MSREVDEIKQRLDIVDIVQTYVPLRKAGANHKGLCPFHRESSPSFMVSQSKQIWHCFGCNEGGDMFSFIQKVEGLDFYDALKMLGDRAGVTIEKQTPQQTDKKQRLREILEVSARCFNAILLNHAQAKAAREYAESRALSRETVDRFLIGYAPDTWDVLMTFLKQRGYTPQEATDAGVAVYNQEKGSYYDRFRGRLTIPLRDSSGRIVGFTARAIAKEFTGGKYINTPQTLLYDKSHVVFGLSEAKQAIKEASCVVVVEGNMDAISSHQAGVKNVVAVSGTAFTEAQISQLKRFTETIVFSFDADAAGVMASRKGIEMALRAGMNVKVLTLPFGKDPDECIRKDVALWQQAIAQAQPVVDALIIRALAAHDQRTSEGKKRITSDVLSILKYLTNPVERAHYVRRLADELQVPPEVFSEMLKTGSSAGAPVAKQAKGPVPAGKKQATPLQDPVSEAVSNLLSLWFVYPDLTPVADLPDGLLFEPELETLYNSWKSFYDSSIHAGEIPLSFEAFSKRLTPDLQKTFARLQMFGETAFADLTVPEATQAIGARHAFLKRRQLDARLQDIQTALKAAEARQDDEAIQELGRQFSDLSAQLASLQ